MGARRLVHISSAGVYGDGATANPHAEDDAPRPVTAYQRSKLASERALVAALEGAPTQWTILRPSLVYAPDSPATAALFREVARRRLWLHGPARALMRPAHVADLVRAVLLVIDRDDLGHEVINIGGARSVDFRELISMIGERVGRSPIQLSAPRWIRRPADVATRAWRSAGQPPALLLRLAREWINASVSIDKARRLLGFEPVPLEWGLDQTAMELRLAGAL
jgi:nucleoside-diphosphate-sugar epimerase